MSFNPVKDHAIHGTLARLLELEKSEILTGPSSDLNDEYRWYIKKIFYLVRHARKILRTKNDLTISISGLNNIDSSALNILNELNNFISNRNLGHITNAFNQAEQGFQIYLKQGVLEPVGSKIELEETLIQTLEGAHTAGMEAMLARSESVDSAVDALENKIAETTAQVSELQSLVIQNEEKTNASLEATDGEIGRLFEKFEISSSAVIAEANKTFAKRSGLLEEQASTILAKMHGIESDARNLVQSVGGLLTTATFSERATVESDLADKFRRITIWLFLIGVVIILSNYIVYLIDHFVEGKFVETPWTIFTRIGTALVVALPAFYTARESARHRTNADAAKQRALELSTLGPFIELLPPEKKDDLRERLADKYFGKTVEPHRVQVPADVDQLVRAVESLIKVVQK